MLGEGLELNAILHERVQKHDGFDGGPESPVDGPHGEDIASPEGCAGFIEAGTVFLGGADPVIREDQFAARLLEGVDLLVCCLTGRGNPRVADLSPPSGGDIFLCHGHAPFLSKGKAFEERARRDPFMSQSAGFPWRFGQLNISIFLCHSWCHKASLMTVGKSAIFRSLCLLFLALYPQQASADGFNNRDFLQMQPEQQKFWLSGAIDTLVHVAAFKDKQIGQCVTDWYFGEKTAERNWLILESFKKYPDHTPTVVLLALTQKACGKYLEVE